MRFPVDLLLFDHTRHSPSLASLSRSMAARDLNILDFCIPVNPYFPTAEMFSRFREELVQALRFYPSSNKAIANELSSVLQLAPETVVVGNGSTELITFLNLTMLRESLAIAVPTFSRWTDEPASLGRAVHLFATHPDDGFKLDATEFVRFVRRTGARAAVICNPNNPTGSLLPSAELLSLLEQLGDLDLLVVDESFIDFADESTIPSIAAEAVTFDNVVILKSLGKNFGPPDGCVHRYTCRRRDFGYWVGSALLSAEWLYCGNEAVVSQAVASPCGALLVLSIRASAGSPSYSHDDGPAGRAFVRGLVLLAW
jgi:histidinol-phosphate/aromatic aminotransferase/cobyric acid decarboxylase-like protein